MKMDELAHIVDAYLEESEEDYVDLWQVAAARRRLEAKTTDETRRISLEIVGLMYHSGLRPGDYSGGDFNYWPDHGCQAMLDRIEREWIAASADPNLAEPICWFARPEIRIA